MRLSFSGARVSDAIPLGRMSGLNARQYAANNSVWNPRDLGATGGGLGDDAPAINAAIASAYNNGLPFVRLPAGVYRTGSTILLKAGVTLIGDGIGATIIVAAGTGFDVVTIPADSPNTSVRELSIVGAAGAGVNAAQRGIYFPPSTTLGGMALVERVEFPVRGGLGVNVGVKIDGNNPHVTVDRCRFTSLMGGTVVSNGYGVITAADYPTVTNCWFQPAAGQGRNLIYFSNGVGCRADNNDLINGAWNIPLTAHSYASGAYDLIITNNRIRDFVGGDIDFAGIGIFGAFKNARVQGNTVDAESATGLTRGILYSPSGVIPSAANVDGLLISGNLVTGTTAEGIAVIGDNPAGVSQYPGVVMIDKNMIRRASRGNAGTYSGIKVERANDVAVTNNTIDCQSLTLNGVFASPAVPAITRMLIEGNRVNDFLGAAVQITGAPGAKVTTNYANGNVI